MSILDSLLGVFGIGGAGATQTGVLTPFSDQSHLAHVTAQDIWPDADLSGIVTSRAAAMKLGAVARGRHLITGAIGGMPLQTYRGTDLATSNGWAAQPERGRPRCITLAWTVDQMLFYGRAWWLVTERNGYGKPVAFQLVTEDRITYDAERGTITVDGEHVYADTDFVRIDSMSEGLLSAASSALTRATLIEAAAAKAGDNPVPAIELHQTEGDPLSTAEIDALISRWALARRGRNGGVAYTNKSIEAKVHGAAAEQLLIQGRNAAALDVARHLNLPAWAIDGAVHGSSLTYSNVPSRSRELIDYTLQPFMDAIAGRLSMDDVSAAGTWFRLDPGRLLRGDFGDRMNAAKTAREADIYSVDELRRMETETPLEGTQ